MKSKSSLPYEIAGTLLGLVGAFVLVAVYFPVLNSGQARIELHGELPLLGYYILMTPIPVAMLIASWFCNRTAQRLKREAAAERPTSEPGKAEKSVEQVLKWVLLAIVLVVVGAFFLVKGWASGACIHFQIETCVRDSFGWPESI